MSLVWRKIQRSNKKAAKYKFTCQLQELTINCGRKWQPQKVAVAWVHRRRRYVTKDHQWEPSITDPYRGIIMWPSEESECLEIITTLYKDPRQQTFDDKEWTFIVEGVSPRGKRKALAGIGLNLRLFVNELPGTQTELQLKLKPMCEHVDLVTMKLILSCQMLKEGNALDDDMQSVASAMSVSHHKADIAELADFDNVSPGDSSTSMNALTYPSPPVTPNDSTAKTMPEDFPARLSTIDEPWRPPEIPKRFTPASTPTPTAPTPVAASVVSIREEYKADSRSQRYTSTTVVSGKLEIPKTAPPQPEAVNELPPVGADLLSWCQAATRGYRGVNVTDFSKCWRNGLAFCALVHRFRPDLIGNFDALNPDDIRGNCKKAFEAAAVLGVPKLIDPEEMVIMVVPDKIAVTSYVYNLRAALTGQSSTSGQNRLSTASPWSPSPVQGDESGRESASTASGSPMIEDRRISTASEKSIKSTPRSEKSPSPIDQKPLMTRNQLMNPFDSDGEETENTEPKLEPTSPSTPTPVSSPVTSTPIAATVNGSGIETKQITISAIDQNRQPALSPITSGGGVDRQEDLKRRARMLLQQYQTDDRRLSDGTSLSPEDEQRRQELKDRARQLIEESQRRPANVVKISDMIASVNEAVWPPRPNKLNQAASSSAPTTRQTTPEHRQYIAQSMVTKESLKEALQVDANAFDRFKRFGSMRTQELTQSINVLSSRFLNQKNRRSASAPRELSSHLSNGSSSGVAEPRPAPVSTSGSLENDTRTREQILAEIEHVAQRQRILDRNAADVEKRWRKAMQDAPGTELEQSLMNEYLNLLNERNMLTRRDMYLNILEKIRDQEEKFQDVQQQLAELMRLEESEKTEVHKRQIDALMEKLIEFVNRRDELMQHLIAHEKETQEAAELAENIINQSIPLTNDDQKNCAIM